MSATLLESRAINEIAGVLYDFLPGKPHPYANAKISFEGISKDLNLSSLWTGGSKRPAITALLQSTLELHRDRFCQLMLEIIKRGMAYRDNKGDPITRDEIQLLNDLIVGVGFKIPKLWDEAFLNSLPSVEVKPEQKQVQVSQGMLDHLNNELLNLSRLAPQARGFAFEKYLKELFAAFDLEPRSSFRLVGEQIDGSLQHDGHTYLIEVKWQNEQIGNRDLSVFQEQVESKSRWSRGLYISFSGFTSDGLEAFARGRSTSIIGFTGEDLFFILDGKMPLPEAISRKTRRAAETGQFLVRIYELSLEQ